MYLSDYIQEEQTALFKEMGVFFAFSDKQFEEGVAENKGKLEGPDDKFVSAGAGMIYPQSKSKELWERFNSIVEAGVKRDLEENGRQGVLARELMNYEIGLSYEGINDLNFREGIHGYGFTEEEILAAYKKHMRETEY